MKVKHDLLLVNVVKKLLDSQGNNSTNFNKQSEKYENQKIIIKTLSKRLDAVEKKNAKLMEKLETQNAASCDQRRKLGVVVKKNFKVEKG